MKCASLLMVLAGTTITCAQPAAPPSREVPLSVDSGPVLWEGGSIEDVRAVFSTVVTVPHAAWLRLRFSELTLAGVVEEGSASQLKLTSLLDGAVQYLDCVSARQWGNTSAYLNGESILVEIVAHPVAGMNRVAIASATAGGSVDSGRSICGGTDDRVLSSDPKTARHMPEGCSTWLHDDANRMFLTAGHCSVSGGDVQQFNVPLSSGSGALNNPPPEDQYVVESASIQTNGGQGAGADYAYFGVSVNSNTGLTPFQRQGQFYLKAPTLPVVAGQTVEVCGYGVVNSPVPPAWQQVQKSHTGPLSSPNLGASGTTVAYVVDTTGGNSGSCVYDITQNRAIGIHTHGYCTISPYFENYGTGINYAPLQSALANPLGVCRTGRGTPTGSLFAIGDAANNFGTCNTSTGGFAKVNVAPPRMEGLAYNPSAGVFYAVSNDTFGVAPGAAGRKLWTVDPGTGVATYIANISGASGVINGLGYSAASGVLYGVIQATGTRVLINTSTGVASLDGTTNAGTVIGAAEFNPADDLLYGIDDSGGVSKLVRFTPATGTVQVVGPLGAGIGDCNGLAITADGNFWTINAATEQLLRINPATGAASVVGATLGFFGASYGLSAVTPPPSGAGCYVNCDASTDVPFLNVADFSCFLSRYAGGDAYANCDGSTSAPTLNVADFTCFLQKYAAGCSAP
jgi:V8-like Glu-specific endopeptidase